MTEIFERAYQNEWLINYLNYSIFWNFGLLSVTFMLFFLDNCANMAGKYFFMHLNEITYDVISFTYINISFSYPGHRYQYFILVSWSSDWTRFYLLTHRLKYYIYGVCVTSCRSSNGLIPGNRIGIGEEEKSIKRRCKTTVHHLSFIDSYHNLFNNHLQS